MPRRRRPRPGSPPRRHHDERPQQRNAANARERARMRVLSKAFCRLKTTLPWVPADTKLSKLDTLRLATSYIAHLRAILTDEHVQPSTHPLNLTWPFSFPQQPAQPPRSSGSPQWTGSRDARHGQDSSSSSSSSSLCPDGDLDDDPTAAAAANGHHQPLQHQTYHQHHLQYSDSLLHIG